MGVTGILLITLPLHMTALGMPRSAAGYLWTALEIGSITTALLLGRLQTRWRPEHVVMVSVAAFGLALTTWPLAASFAVLLLLAALSGLLEGPTLPAMFAARQRYSPESLQGRVSTTAASLRVGAAALGQAAGGLLVPRVGTHAALLVIAAGLVAAAALGRLAALSHSTPALAHPLITPAPTRHPSITRGDNPRPCSFSPRHKMGEGACRGAIPSCGQSRMTERVRLRG
jgi:MFS family permease